MFLEVSHLAQALIAQTGGEGGAAGGCANNPIFLPVIMMGVLYVVWILPARKERKAHQAMLENLKRGDEVVTSSGLLGTIADMTDKVITLEVAKNVKVRVLRSAISKKAAAEAPAASVAKTEEKESKT